MLSNIPLTLNAPSERSQFWGSYSILTLFRSTPSMTPQTIVTSTWYSSTWSQISIIWSMRGNCKKFIQNIFCTSSSKLFIIFILLPLFTEIWNPLIFSLTAIAWPKFVILDWWDLWRKNNLWKLWHRELLRDGTGHLKFFWDHILMIGRLICGVLAVLLLKWFLKVLFFPENALQINFKESFSLQANPHHLKFLP